MVFIKVWLRTSLFCVLEGVMISGTGTQWFHERTIYLTIDQLKLWLDLTKGNPKWIWSEASIHWECAKIYASFNLGQNERRFHHFFFWKIQQSLASFDLAESIWENILLIKWSWLKEKINEVGESMAPPWNNYGSISLNDPQTGSLWLLLLPSATVPCIFWQPLWCPMSLLF